jgi:hypothetical protein
MKEAQVKKWESTRAKGKLHFILFRGVLLWGLPMFVFMAFVNNPFADGFTSSAAITYYIIWPVAGLLYGMLTWYMSERTYKKQLASRTNT